MQPASRFGNLWLGAASRVSSCASCSRNCAVSGTSQFKSLIPLLLPQPHIREARICHNEFPYSKDLKMARHDVMRHPTPSILTWIPQTPNPTVRASPLTPKRGGRETLLNSACFHIAIFWHTCTHAHKQACLQAHIHTYVYDVQVLQNPA